MELFLNKGELIELVIDRFKDIRLGKLIDLIGEPLPTQMGDFRVNDKAKQFHINADPNKKNIYMGCVAQKRIIEPAVAEYFNKQKTTGAEQQVKLMKCVEGKWVGESAGIDYIRLFGTDGPLQFAGFGNYWSSILGGYSWVIFGHMNKKPENFEI